MDYTQKKPYEKIKCEYCETIISRHRRSKHRKSKFCLAHQKMHKSVIGTILKNKELPDERIKHPYLNSEGEIIFLTLKQASFFEGLNDKTHKYIKL